MSSVMMLNKDLICEIYNDLNNFKHLSHNELFTYCLQERLKASLKKYNLELDSMKDYLHHRWPHEVLRTINFMQKAEDKAIIESNFITEIDIEDTDDAEYIN